jgi:hypothetical protein
MDSDVYNKNWLLLVGLFAIAKTPPASKRKSVNSSLNLYPASPDPGLTDLLSVS